MKRTIIFLVVVALCLGVWYGLEAAGYLGKSEFSSDPQVAELQRLQKNFAEKPGTRPDESQRQAMGEKIRELSDEQRREFFESGRRSMENMMEARMERFFALPPEEQKKQLDEDINRMEKARKEGRGRGGPRGEVERGGDSKTKQAGDEKSAGSAKKESGAQRPPRDRSPEARNQRRKQMLSRSSPKQRAMRTAYKTRMDARMRERGLQPPPSR